MNYIVFKIWLCKTPFDPKNRRVQGDYEGDFTETAKPKEEPAIEMKL